MARPCSFTRDRGGRLYYSDGGEAGHDTLPHHSVPALLRVLPRRAPRPEVPAAALHRQLARDRSGAGGDRHPPAAAAAGRADRRLWARVGRALLLRAQPARHLPSALVQPGGRLGALVADHDPQEVSGRPRMIARSVPTAIARVAAPSVRSRARRAREAATAAAGVRPNTVHAST